MTDLRSQNKSFFSIKITGGLEKQRKITIFWGKIFIFMAAWVSCSEAILLKLWVCRTAWCYCCTVLHFNCDGGFIQTEAAKFDIEELRLQTRTRHRMTCVFFRCHGATLRIRRRGEKNEKKTTTHSLKELPACPPARCCLTVCFAATREKKSIVCWVDRMSLNSINSDE